MVEGTMNHKPSRITFLFITLLFIGQLPFFSTHAQQTVPTVSINEQHPDLLLIVSPQYAHDTDVNNALLTYITAVHNDIGWNTQIIPIQEDENTYQSIDAIIETIYADHPVKACIMIGEDLDTPLAGDADYLEQPSTLPWSALGGSSAYDMTEQGILCKPTTMTICISLLYPTHDLSYQQKKTDILSAFHKFTTQRHTTYPQTIKVFESSTLNTNSKTLYQTLGSTSTLSYMEDAPNDVIATSLTHSYAAFFIHGHSTPSGTDVNSQKNSGWFSSEYLDSIHTPFFGADGCYVGGWWSTQQDNNKLDASINADWYGSKIFTSPSIQVMALGLLSQTGFTHPVSFLENVFPHLLHGTTLAEAMIGQTTIGDTIIVGDPTFHFIS
jgi:hypothetical protein